MVCALCCSYNPWMDISNMIVSKRQKHAFTAKHSGHRISNFTSTTATILPPKHQLPNILIKPELNFHYFSPYYEDTQAENFNSKTHQLLVENEWTRCSYTVVYMENGKSPILGFWHLAREKIRSTHKTLS